MERFRDMKKVSIVLPTYNGEKFIRDSIGSILNQTYQNWELIIVNDCSNDNTLNIINDYVQKDGRIKVISNEQNLKLPASLNVGFSQAQGEYYTWTSDDNIYKPTAIEAMTKYLDNNADCDLVSFNFDFVDEDLSFKNEFYKNRTTLQLTQHCNIGACFMYRKEIVEKVGKYDEDTFCAEDYDYWCRVAIKGNIHYVDENLYTYRMNPQSLTATKEPIVREKALNIRYKYAETIAEKCGFNEKEKIQLLLCFYDNEHNKKWLKIAEHINKALYIKERTFQVIKKIFSVTEENNRYVIKLLGIKLKIKQIEKDTDSEETKKLFLNYKIRKNSILIVEPNAYHAEILPAFVNYFQEIGYDVDLFLRHENLKDLPFIDTTGINIFSGCPLHIKKMLKLKKIQEYEYVFFSTSAFWEEHRKHLSYLDYLGFVPKAKHGILMVEHNIIPYLKQYKEEKYLKGNRLFSCSGLEKVPMLSPSYYGNFENTLQKDSNVVRFIVVGRTNKDCKNVELLVNTVQKLIDNSINNFEIIIDGENSYVIPSTLRPYIIENSKVKFNKLYDDMQKSHFILFLLDDTNPFHDRYKQGTTTGASLDNLKKALIR